MRRALAAWLLIVVGCSGSESAGGPSAPVDSGAEAAIDGGSTNDRLTLAKTLEQLVVGSCREVDVGVPIDVQAYIEIGSTAEAEPFFAHVSSTGKNADSVQGIASASKWPSSVTIVEALSDPEGKGAPPGTSVTALKLLPKSKSSDGFTFVSSVTPPSDVIEGITLEHLLSFSSGFHVNESGGPSAWDTCANDLAETNTSCAITALSRRPKSIVSGSVFSYGSLHLEVAAAMAEERTGQSFVELVEARLNARLGLTDAARFRFPRPLTPEKDHPNPLVAGGMHTSARSYRAFLRGLAAGTFKAWAAVDPDRSRIAGLPRVIDPAASSATLDTALWEYGLGHWVQPRGVVSSAGKSGFYPWLDKETNTWGINAFEGASSAGWGEESTRCGLKLQAAVRACLVDGRCTS